MAKTKLTKIQMKFCEEYIKDYNATQAYLRASPDANYDTAKSKGCNILKMPLAQDYLTVLEQELYKEKRINAEHIANELADIAFADPTGAEGLTYQIKMKALELLQKQLGLQQQSIKANVNTNDICITIGNNLEKKGE